MQLSAESVLISALLNTQDATAARSHGITPDHFIGYRTEYNWLLTYEEHYGESPTIAAFREAFPHFTLCEHEHVRSACDMVLKAYGKRNLTAAVSDAMELLGIGDLDQAYRTLVAAEPRRAKPPRRDLLTELSFLDDWDEPIKGVEVPYRTVQKHTGGIRPGNLWYFAARPGQGKSAHLVNMVTHAVLAHCKVKFYSLEMSEDEVRARFHAALATHYGYSGIDLTGIRNRTIDSGTYKTFVGELADMMRTKGRVDIHTPAHGQVTPGVIASSAEDYDLVVVDYVGLMKSDSGTRAVDDWRIAAGISNDLKIIAGSTKTGLLAAAQINREGDHGTEPPKIKNLAQTDALAQDGDVVLTLRDRAGVVSVMSLEKNRHGLGGLKFHTKFDPNHGVFDEITADDAESLVLAAEQERYQ